MASMPYGEEMEVGRRKCDYSLRQQIDRWWHDACERRMDFEPDWRDLSDYVLWRTNPMLDGNYGGADAAWSSSENQGSGEGDGDSRGSRNYERVENTALKAVKTTAAGLQDGATPPAGIWFKLVPPKEFPNPSKEISQWIAYAEERLYDSFRKAALYEYLPQMYRELCLFGTSALGMFKDDENGFRFEHYPLGSYWLQEDDQGVVNGFYRLVSYSVDQIVDRFCMDGSEVDEEKLAMLSPSAREAWRDRKFSLRYDIMEAIVPADDREYADGEELKHGDMPFVQIAYERSGESVDEDGKTRLLLKDGFKSFPILTPRWYLRTGYPYGESPGMDALDDIIQLQTMTSVVDVAVEKVVNPPMVASYNMKGINLMPGHVNYNPNIGDNATHTGLRPAYQVDPKIDHMLMRIDTVETRIRDALFSNVFLAITDIGKANTTATEIEFRQQEKLTQLGEILTRLDSDLLKPLIENGFRLLLGDEEEEGLLDPYPEEMDGWDLGIDYLSKIARAQKAADISSVTDSISFIAETAAMQRDLGVSDTVIDLLDADGAVERYHQYRGTPPDVIRSRPEVMKLRDGRAKAAEEERQMAMMQAQIQMAQAAAQVQTGQRPNDNLAADYISAEAGAPALPPAER